VETGVPLDLDEDGAPDPATAAAAAVWLSRRLPALDPEPIVAETCLYTNLPGDRFACERRNRIVVGSACSGHGFKFAPLLGAELAALAAEAL
jgi:glycine/D-amino acid oxidase-like deaminating enzyme